MDTTSIVEGPVYTSGNSFRARAEAQQRNYRARVLKEPHAEHAHWLTPEAADAGKNFVLPLCFDQARARAESGKGVERSRTFANMLSSQAMCFNIFAPLTTPSGLANAAKVLNAFIPAIKTVEAITIEYTPENALFKDQSGQSGVDCDVLVDFRATDGAKGVLVIETKFVEPEFSTCGFRKNGVKKPCPKDVKLDERASQCRYSEKGYLYWQRTLEARSLSMDRVKDLGCPFGGAAWQLWVNHTLAHAEAQQRKADHPYFAVVAPAQNKALLRDGKTLSDFRLFLTRPETMVFIPLEQLIEQLAAAGGTDSATWVTALRSRYIVA